MRQNLPLLAAFLLAIGQTVTAPAIAQQGSGTKLKAFSLTAPGTSAWEKAVGGRIRLVTTAAGPDGTASAALEIELDEGFKTYWWNPGADGIPPQVSFFGSSNVAETKLTLPPPYVFRDRTVSVGYKTHVRFPIAVSLERLGEPYRLTANGIVGFCADICVPVPFRLQATPPTSNIQAGLVGTASQQMLAPSEAMRLESARFDPTSGKMEVDATVPDTDVLLELVVANPDDRILPPAAQAVHQKGNRATFSFDLAPEQAPADQEILTFTLIVGQFGQLGRIGVEQKLAVSRAE